MARYIGTTSIEVDVDIDDIISEVDTQDLIDIIKQRGGNIIPVIQRVGTNVDEQLKMEVVFRNIHKYTWIEICNIFEPTEVTRSFEK